MVLSSTYNWATGNGVGGEAIVDLQVVSQYVMLSYFTSEWRGVHTLAV